MELDEIREHWQDWSRRYGQNLRATTKAPSAKMLEIDAFARRIAALMGETPKGRVLEVGCGNGINIISLALRLPGLTFHGFDLVEEMVEAGRKNAADEKVSGRVTFSTGNALDPAAAEGVEGPYDVILTDRCLINLNSTELQCQAIAEIAGLLAPGGHLLMIENSVETHARQNDLRQMLGLERRVAASFNTFFDEPVIREFLPTCGLELTDVEDFISLHDIVLYVLLPAINGGNVDYDDPMVSKAAELNAKLSAAFPGELGAFGQNRLFVCKRTEN